MAECCWGQQERGLGLTCGGVLFTCGGVLFTCGGVLFTCGGVLLGTAGKGFRSHLWRSAAGDSRKGV